MSTTTATTTGSDALTRGVLRITLRPGDCLYLPRGWVHYAATPAGPRPLTQRCSPPFAPLPGPLQTPHAPGRMRTTADSPAPQH
jgi:hypothetical protein